MSRAFNIPSTAPFVGEARITRLPIASGQTVSPQQPLLELFVDFSAAVFYDCPPTFFLRFHSLEAGVVEQVFVGEGDFCSPGTPIAVIGGLPEAGAAAAAERELRATMVAVQGDPFFEPPI